jgi:hypothetical protein
MTRSTPSNQLHNVWDYPLFEALYGRRSRRFGLGFEIAEGPFGYKSERSPVPLSELEEALLVAAGIGVTGIPLWDGRRGRAPPRSLRRTRGWRGPRCAARSPASRARLLAPHRVVLSCLHFIMGRGSWP